MSIIIKQAEMDESVLMTRVLSLLGHIQSLFQDHGGKPLSKRAEALKQRVAEEMAAGNPYNTETPEKGYCHQFLLVELLGEEPLESANLSDVRYAITEGHYSGEVSQTPLTWVNRALMDDLLLDQGSDPGFLDKGDEDEQP